MKPIAINRLKSLVKEFQQKPTQTNALRVDKHIDRCLRHEETDLLTLFQLLSGFLEESVEETKKAA